MRNADCGMRDREKNGSGIRTQGYGTLYMVSTPIGNLEDITLRALRVLKGVDLIAAESAGHSRGLCRHYGIKTRLTTYNQHNRKVRGPELVKQLKSGLDIALVTNAGVPAVSDPGVLLAAQALAEDIKVSPVPGPSSVTAALSVCGLRSDRFLFRGFLSSRPGKRRKELKGLAAETCTMVFFEAPHRIEAMLRDVAEILGDREMVLLREMTKLYEELIRGRVSEVLDRLKEDRIKGEFTLVVAGGEGARSARGLPEEVRERMEGLLRRNRVSMKDIATRISAETDLTYREVYRACLALKRGGPADRPEGQES